MNETILNRLAQMRALMEECGLKAVIVPQADPHQGEYLAPHWQVRRWLSGFTGSAGDLVVTADKAALWTDSRYFIQAASQLEGTSIELMKDGLADTPSIAGYLCSTLSAGDRVGLDGMLFTHAAVEALRAALAVAGIELVTDVDVIDRIWLDRPALPEGKIFVHDIRYAGREASAKIADILADARGKGADAVFVAMLDEIAWTLNIRCNDVNHTPVATAFLYVAEGDTVLFIDPAKLTDQTRAYLASQGVSTRAYGDVKAFLAALPGQKVLVDAGHIGMELLDILGDKAIDGGVSAAAIMKSVKNDIQLDGVRAAMVRDGVAMVRSLMEIEHRVGTGVATTELDVAEILRRHRSAGELYFDESFGTIAGYGPHGAIVHYEADEVSSSTLEPHGLLLIDSGAQYLDGTTDITRTIALGQPTAQERTDFTLVMKGHIALATAVFPAGTRGAQLDALARQFLWKHGLSYLHGTGHGVGHFLSVHEGPHSVRLNNVEAPLLPGSITSNEPGVYRENVHGIRCENLVLCRHEMTTDFGEFLGFETLTLCPFDRSLFDTSLMTAEEIAWVDSYHATVAQALMPALATKEERAWLDEHTKPLED
ncbi:MAG: aminopeptidase P family protein [Muribaculaceae bacterium]|nr:aminopeptidase P family protein [Muribaculaceae bacterium]